jgi:flagellin-like protein
MKANRKFVQADEAVSPVIAVILMVAITVVLAATVFVLVSDIGGNKAAAAPTFNLQPNEGSDKLSVESAASNADWNRLQVKVESCTGGATARVWIGGLAGATHVNAAGVATAASAPLMAAAANCGGAATPERVAPSAAKMVANDYLQFCGAGSITNAKILLTDTTANVLAYTYTFTDLANCT